MFSKVYSGGLRGIEGYLVQVEADVSDGLPGFHMVGYLAAEVREAEDRVRTALRNSGFLLHARKVTVNLSPADVRKDGTSFDLPIAVAVMVSYGLVDQSVAGKAAFIGELGLDGRIKGVRGVLSMVAALRDAGVRLCFLPEENIAEGLAVEEMRIVKAENLREVMEMLQMPERIAYENRNGREVTGCFPEYDLDFREVSGQQAVRRATEVAAAGQHNILYLGPPGSGKSMIAQRIPTIMPLPSEEERLEISKVYSVCGMLPPGKALMAARPFRAPHHTVSPQALTGGGGRPKPGEISLATRGILFLDELPEFRRGSLEILRQPLEEHRVTVSRVHGTYEFPANFMLAAAMNGCPCGHYPNRDLCSCSEQEIRRYLGRISGPLLDRIDICVEAAPVSYRDIRGGGENESSAEIRERVERAREIQKRRFKGSSLLFNNEMGGREIRRYCALDPEEDRFLQDVYQKMQLSPRGCHKILKVARTIADLDGGVPISRAHLCEAIGYRDMETKYWGRGEK